MLQQYMNQELSDVQARFRKGRGIRDQIAVKFPKSGKLYLQDLGPHRKIKFIRNIMILQIPTVISAPLRFLFSINTDFSL